jgi:hypothetical protein
VGRLVDPVDTDRAAFAEHYFHTQWPHLPLYHAMLNTAAGDDIVIHTILTLTTVVEQPGG